MKWICKEGCYANPAAIEFDENGKPTKWWNNGARRGFKTQEVYEIREDWIDHLAFIGLFPENFEPEDSEARMYVANNTKKLKSIVESRILPYRNRTLEEQAEWDAAHPSEDYVAAGGGQIGMLQQQVAMQSNQINVLMAALAEKSEKPARSRKTA